MSVSDPDWTSSSSEADSIGSNEGTRQRTELFPTRKNSFVDLNTTGGGYLSAQVMLSKGRVKSRSSKT